MGSSEENGAILETGSSEEAGAWLDSDSWEETGAIEEAWLSLLGAGLEVGVWLEEVTMPQEASSIPARSAVSLGR